MTSDVVVVDRVSSDIVSQPHYATPVTATTKVGMCDDDDTNDWFLINTKNICRACHSINSIRIDWSQGDRICTACGVVQEERILDMNPEWRDYGDRDDRCSGGDDLLFGSYRARSGMIPNNESKYIGGLQSTTLSSTLYNGTNGVRKQGSATSTNIAQRLRKVHRKIEHRMDQQNKVAMKNATLNLQLLRKLQRQELERREAIMTTTDADTENTDTITATMNDDDDNDDLPDYGSNFEWTEERVNTTSSNDFEHLVQEQERLVMQQRQALYANKWSLDRAKLLFGSSNPGNHNHDANIDEIESDPILCAAAQDLFICYTLICTSCTTLQLPVAIMDEAASLLCQYASRRDGLKVKGIASTPIHTTVPTNRNNTKHNAMMIGKRWGRPSNNAKTIATSPSITPKTAIEVEEEKQAVRQMNKVRQMASLCSGTVFWIARYRNKPRTLLSVCASIVYNNNEKVSKRHCSRALHELKECFPELLRLSTAPTTVSQVSTSNVTATSSIVSHLRKPKFSVPEAISVQQQSHGVLNSMDVSVFESIANMVDHLLQKLHLPPVAEASIRYLVLYHYVQENHQSVDADTQQYHHHPALLAKMIPVRCAALAYMISSVGRTMQQLAKQSQQQEQPVGSYGNEKRRYPIATSWGGYSNMETKKAKCTVPSVADEDRISDETMSFDLFNDNSPIEQLAMDGVTGINVRAETSTNGQIAVAATSSSIVLAEHRAYEMRRMWDAWSEQVPWDRSLVQIEQSTNVTRKNTTDYYKQHIYPNRFVLLEELRDSITDDISLRNNVGLYSMFLEAERAILRKTPLSSVLLSNILVAAPLLKNDVKL